MSSLFRYLACTPLFPIVHGSSLFITWENIDDTTAKAVIQDKDISVGALARFDSKGGIDSIESCQKTHPETGRQVPGHFASRFASCTDVGGCRIPMQITSEIILPKGEYLCAEYTIIVVEFDAPYTMNRSGF